MGANVTEPPKGHESRVQGLSAWLDCVYPYAKSSGRIRSAVFRAFEKKARCSAWPSPRRRAIGIFVGYVIFSQLSLDQVTEDRAAPQRIKRLFAAEWRLSLAQDSCWATHLLELSTQTTDRLDALLRERPTTDNDLALASQAEARGQTGGMAALASRCPTLWELEILESTSTRSRGLLLATLAHVCLGPVMPNDASRLLGVRSALRLAELGT